MMYRALIVAVLAVLPATAALAEARQTLGWGRFFDNDALGDLHDRWHSGAYTISLVRGPAWTGQLPDRFGEVLEYRFSGATVTPANLGDPAADDRRFAAPLSFGLYTHLNWRGFETSLGGDLVAVGPQTGLGDFQSRLHGMLGVQKADLSDQIGNAFYPTLRAELGRDFALSGQVNLRPFIAAQAGVETMVRAGGDVAHVFSSALLPAGGAAEASDTRGRLRAGLAWQGEKSSAFYGITYLTPEFDSQPAGQLVGSVNLNLRF